MDRATLTALPAMLAAMALIPRWRYRRQASDHRRRRAGLRGVVALCARRGAGAAGAGTRADLRHLLDWRLWLRGALVTGGIVSILTALRTEPIADVFGAFFTGPLLSYALSARLLREPITPGRTALLLLGFAGVLMVVRPGFGMTPGLGVAMLAGLFYGAYLTASRWLAPVAPAGALLVSQLLVGAIVLAPFGLVAWPGIDLRTGLLILGSAAGSMLGNLLLIHAMGRAQASRLAPFVYTQLVAATMLGLAVFGTFPEPLTLAGLALLLASGLASLALGRRG